MMDDGRWMMDPGAGRLRWLSVMVAAGLFLGCDGGTEEADPPVGALVFSLNGEGFAREGFVSEDGWRVDFDHVWVNVAGPTAFQVVETEELDQALLILHAGHPHAEIPEGSAHIALLGAFLVDVHQGDGPTELGTIDDAPIGNYNRLSFSLAPATAESQGFVEECDGASLILQGVAKKDDQEIPFTIRLDEAIDFTACGPHPEDIGVLAEDATAEVELTLHFDHIFGDVDEGPADTDDPETVNHLAIGFGPFAALAADGAVDLAQADLEAMPEWDQLLEALLTLGHTGEAHCNATQR